MRFLLALFLLATLAINSILAQEHHPVYLRIRKGRTQCIYTNIKQYCVDDQEKVFSTTWSPMRDGDYLRIGNTTPEPRVKNQRRLMSPMRDGEDYLRIGNTTPEPRVKNQRRFMELESW
ncbi:uncharacterized protein LOC133531173 isoform X2 [Cydia pomonella]|uniref:uncharacterized protein LOC133531173 isoform X2 n=1 Tax=Cydia pomonella TaxID=82600 RepID=UPI002ADD94FB|nr:uncharacterized protein LOC133531173 isoform X2 [Cydia pomonella]